jgi:hypothetical protein
MVVIGILVIGIAGTGARDGIDRSAGFLMRKVAHARGGGRGWAIDAQIGFHYYSGTGFKP